MKSYDSCHIMIFVRITEYLLNKKERKKWALIYFKLIVNTILVLQVRITACSQGTKSFLVHGFPEAISPHFTCEKKHLHKTFNFKIDCFVVE